MEKRMIIHRTAVVPALLLCLFFSGGAWAMSAPWQAGTEGNHFVKSSKDSRERILAVLETKITDAKVIEKASDKLRSLDERELGLMKSLCDRIAADSGSAGADIAFSLMSAMLVLS